MIDNDNQDRDPELEEPRKPRSRKRFGFFMLFTGILLGACLAFGVTMLTGGRLLTAAQSDYYSGMDKVFGKAYTMQTMFEKNAYYDYNGDEVSETATNAVASSLTDDEYVKYYTAAEYENLERNYIKAYVGIGLACTEQDGAIVVTRLISDSPADEAGIKVGDVIVKIDDKAVDSLKTANDLLSGEAGEAVTVVIKSGDKTESHKMNRVELEEECIEYGVLEDADAIGYIRLFKFRENSSKEFDSAVKYLKNKGCTKLIIDFRGNPGGLKEEGVKVADRLLPAGKIMTEKSKNKDDEVEKSDASSIDIEYVLLVDENTASAAEIVAAAVKDNAGGTIIGKTTYGKGLIQTIHKFEDGTAIKYTTGEYLSPNGKSINKNGVEPDITSDDPLQDAIKQLS
ncbi:MAG: PDZ domain-containing protein [Clostridiales bacterium]|jgi:carboxyl-terminal processing protease|nr:PDZ domain-containing protein [Clostridiales bacterium]